MNDVSVGCGPEVSYLIDYNLFASPVYNLDFKGSGLLTIQADGPTYTFSGRPRGFFAGKSAKQVFAHHDISNVLATGRTLQFKTSAGKSGAKKQPFVCHFRDADTAREAADLLPKTTDVAFVEGNEFTGRLDALVGPISPWRSVTNVIVALNILVFVIMGFLGAGWFDVESIMPYVLYGANNGAATTDGEWWRLVTSTFMHFGVLHLALNMWALFHAGHLVEKLLGRRLYALAYLGSGIAGGFASIAWHGDQAWSAGASGAVFGVYGMIVGFMLREKQAMPSGVYKKMLKSTLGFAGYNILFGLARTGIDNAAHLGGLLGGIALGWLLAMPLDAQSRSKLSGRRLRLGLAALGAMLAFGIGLTPRYDYRISDLIAWEKTNRSYIDKEVSLLKQHQESLGRPWTAAQASSYADWIEVHLIPFYEDWGRALDGLALAPDRDTTRTRKALLNIFSLRLQSYRDLAAGLRADDQGAKDRFAAEDALVVLEIEKLSGKQSPKE
ncbi:MAG: rhomboid family intramembrane serine protease [Candidatus Didemnitutus sp.]|nr:rhomboid family intramembrane serine protease [Candidatus Didemnitutus sp.]